MFMTLVNLTSTSNGGFTYMHCNCLRDVLYCAALYKLNLFSIKIVSCLINAFQSKIASLKVTPRECH